MANIIKGQDLMVFTKIGKGTVKSLAFATSHQLSLSANISSIQTKDHGRWPGKEITGLDWNITTDNLYTVDAFNELYTAWMNATVIDIYFTLKSDSEIAGTPPTVNLPGDSADTWTPSTTKEGFYGRAYITSLSATAASGDNATFSATFEGVGSLVKGVYGSVEQQLNGDTQITANIAGTNNSITVAKASSYDSNTQYYLMSQGELVSVDVTSGSFQDSKQVYYKEVED